MGFSIRKSKRIGSMRVNISKSGIGASMGPKGLRGGVNARGNIYFQGGAGGLYFNDESKKSD
jgi:hypothetical protein